MFWPRLMTNLTNLSNSLLYSFSLVNQPLLCPPVTHLYPAFFLSVLWICLLLHLCWLFSTPHLNKMPCLFPKTLLKTSKCQLPLNIYLAHEPDMQDIVKLKPWTQPELKTIIKDFLTPRHDQHYSQKNLELFWVYISQGLSDLCQLLHILVGTLHA